MLSKPSTCAGCPLEFAGDGFMAPSLAGSNGYGVALVGEALGEHEAEEGSPFVGPAGFKLTRLIEWAGLERSRFDIWNVVWCRPPGNSLDGAPWERGAIDQCRSHHWGELPSRARVLVPLGNVALSAFTGWKGILTVRGYIQGGPSGTHLLPTVHPSFIQRGQSKYSAAFIHDLQKAVELARDGLHVELNSYSIDPLPGRAYEWAREYREFLDRFPQTRLAYDIETPGKGEDEGDLDEEDDPTYQIYRIGFSYRGHHALTVPWAPEYIPAIRLLMESPGEKVVWNAGFDNPRIRAAGVGIGGVVHDGMVAWHVLHSDLPKGLAFVATFTCPWQPAWKHLSGSAPGFYNCTDADVELRSMIAIEAELKKVGLWDVYVADVVEMEPILLHMHERGLLIDRDLRLQRAIQLAEKQGAVLDELESLVPISARRYSPENGYVKDPEEATTNPEAFTRIDVEVVVKRCDRCGATGPTKPHFRTLKKPTAKRPQNPCSGAGVVEGVETVSRLARLDDFKPSREQLMRYQRALGRQIPTVPDKKTKQRKASMAEKAIKELMRKFPSDKLYPLVLEYRELDKLAGTYIGRPAV